MKDQCISIGEKNDRRPWAFYDESLVNLNCTFERGLCMWKNLKRDDQRDWILNRGRTRTSRTGPSVDHTTKSRNGKYLYEKTGMYKKEYFSRKYFFGSIRPIHLLRDIESSKKEQQSCYSQS